MSAPVSAGTPSKATMKRFVNKAAGPINFTLGGQPYKLRVGEEFQVPDKFAFALKEMGLPVEQIGQEAEPPPPEDAPKLTIAEFERVMASVGKRFEASMDAVRRDFVSLGEKCEALAAERDALTKGLSDAVARIDALEKAATAPAPPEKKPGPKQAALPTSPTPPAP